jgi:hypothetical protein
MPHPLAADASAPLPSRWRIPASAVGASREAANDEDGAIDVALMRAAMRLTGERGTAAARFAHREAERAYFAGGGPSYRWWLSLTRVLDRMLATEFRASLGGEALPRG